MLWAEQQRIIHKRKIDVGEVSEFIYAQVKKGKKLDFPLDYLYYFVIYDSDDEPISIQKGCYQINTQGTVNLLLQAGYISPKHKGKNLYTPIFKEMYTKMGRRAPDCNLVTGYIAKKNKHVLHKITEGNIMTLIKDLNYKTVDFKVAPET